MLSKIVGFYNRLPEWVKKAVTDAVESGIAAVVGLQLTFPQSWSDAKGLGVTIGVAFAAAVVAALRRAVKAKLGIA